MTYREGEFVYADEETAFRAFIGRAHPASWGTMTIAEWKVRPTNQSVSWEEWCKQHRTEHTAEETK